MVWCGLPGKKVLLDRSGVRSLSENYRCRVLKKKCCCLEQVEEKGVLRSGPGPGLVEHYPCLNFSFYIHNGNGK